MNTNTLLEKPYRRRREQKICSFCKTAFQPKKAKVIFCSNICRGAATREKSSSYGAIHMYLRYTYPKSGICDLCKGVGKTEYAKKRESSYTYNRNDYQELCRPCHRKYDVTDQLREKCRRRMLGAKNAHKYCPVRVSKGTFIKEFESFKSAEVELGFKVNSISSAITSKKSMIDGYKLERIEILTLLHKKKLEVTE